jgi:antitoxin protein of toxin-antitoxin system
MGIFDKASALAKRATKAAKDHSAQVEKTVDKVTDTVDKQTGKKHTKQLDQVDDSVRKYLDK